jgi:endoglucanase
MNGSKWTATSNQTWCTLSVNSSNVTGCTVGITVTANTATSDRSARVKFLMDSKDSAIVIVTQKAKAAVVYPDYSNWITPNATGMSSDAKILAAKMIAGWNVGNSLEVPAGETGWGNPVVTQQLIDSVKAAGINAIRIPCAWNSHLESSTTWKIQASWLARVKEVVDYCYKNNMYVILNIHWDGGWLENNPTYAKQEVVNAEQKALWQQIATYFRDYDEHLLFAGTNEVHASTDPVAENFAVQMSYNQTFVNAVRSTGGRNHYRNLVVQAYNTNINYAVSNLTVSNDSVANRLFVEVHYYDPYDFCGLETDASWATAKSLWGINYNQYGTISSWGQEDYVVSQFQKMKTNFFDKGYPVILGEFGAIRRSSLTGDALTYHLASRAHYYQYVSQQAKTYGLIPFAWDNGSTGNNTMALFNRTDGSVFDAQALKAYLAGISAGSYPQKRFKL